MYVLLGIYFQKNPLNLGQSHYLPFYLQLGLEVVSNKGHGCFCCIKIMTLSFLVHDFILFLALLPLLKFSKRQKKQNFFLGLAKKVAFFENGSDFFRQTFPKFPGKQCNSVCQQGIVSSVTATQSSYTFLIQSCKLYRQDIFKIYI